MIKTNIYIPKVTLELYSEENKLTNSAPNEIPYDEVTNVLSDDTDTNPFGYEECNIMNMIN
ncbi:hypothetical protein [Clostridium vincentii]|uniref:Uncharacterized protein n=1 Tax=Clostridium vincentii TaxID=52704 RepID=A0A2T0BD70_9CLOT|nr:hypothetical protein [Clostridium vincentii]PRR81782.1 hypothetical protein CLVI_22710 [Clostridium vincentii]